jgi:hypothetical protein
MGISPNELSQMTMRQFQYCIDGYDKLQENKMTMCANLAIMIANPKSIKNFLSSKIKNVGLKGIVQTERTPEEIRKRNKAIDADFQRVRDSPTFTKREISFDEMLKGLKGN